MKLDDFNYYLPKNLIAKRPRKSLKKSKLLVCKEKIILDFYDIVKRLNSNDVLVFNNTKVLPVVILGYHKFNKIKITLLNCIDKKIWTAFIKPSKKIHVGETIIFNKDIRCELKSKKTSIVELTFNCDKKKIIDYINVYGNLPLPPYVKATPDKKIDEKFYQTIFASNPGAVACPTAGLHFDKNIINELNKKKVTIVETTLHVGAGTFLPLKKDNVIENELHKERGIISIRSAKKINDAIKKGKKIVAVGTTVLRLLEACHKKYKKIKYFNEETDLFIYPGFKFKVVDKLLTNFHLPKSSLLILVSAFAGKDNILGIYNFAIQNKMNFFSFGDAMIIEKNEL